MAARSGVDLIIRGKDETAGAMASVQRRLQGLGTISKGIGSQLNSVAMRLVGAGMADQLIRGLADSIRDASSWRDFESNLGDAIKGAFSSIPVVGAMQEFGVSLSERIGKATAAGRQDISVTATPALSGIGLATRAAQALYRYASGASTPGPTRSESDASAQRRSAQEDAFLESLRARQLSMSEMLLDAQERQRRESARQFAALEDRARTLTGQNVDTALAIIRDTQSAQSRVRMREIEKSIGGNGQDVQRMVEASVKGMISSRLEAIGLQRAQSASAASGEIRLAPAVERGQYAERAEAFRDQERKRQREENQTQQRSFDRMVELLQSIERMMLSPATAPAPTITGIQL